MNKYSKQLFTLLALSFFSFHFSPSSAKPVSSSTAIRVAQNVLHRVDLRDITPSTVSQYYIFVGSDDHGFAIVAADDCSMPLLAYSTAAPFSIDNISPATENWLASYARQIDEMRSNGVAPSDLVTRAWAEGHSLSATTKNASLADSVPQLLTTTWSQNPYYNDLCPYDTTYNEHAVTGCGATATAQVMKYWNFPATGYGSHGYVDETYGYLFANFDSATYLWDSMPDALTAVSSAAQVTAVASLMSDVGIAIEMGYGVGAVGGSWSYIYNDFGQPSIENGLNRFFKYRSTLHHFDRDETSEADWDYYLKADLCAGRPIIYRAADENDGGHIFVCDGYDAYGAFHFNWGWGGYGDGYYYMGALNVTVGYWFNFGHVAILGIEPDTTFDPTASVAITPVVTSPSYGLVEGGGNYNFGDTVILLAVAHPGYRFVGWANGVKDNPIEFYATDSRTDSAIFVPMTGDTLGYTSDLMVSAYGWGYPARDIYWGIKLPAECFDSDHVLTAVQLFCNQYNNDSVYSISVYSGGDSIPQTLVYVDSMVTRNYGWVTYLLDSAVVFNQNEPLWITVRCYGFYPASVSFYSGNPESVMWNGNGGNPSDWHSFVDDGVNYSFMLRAVMGHGLPAYTVTTASNADSLGTTTGDGIYPQGTPVTIEASPASNARFLYWSDGSTEPQRTIFVSSDTLLTAYFEGIDTTQGINVVDAAEMGVWVNGRTVSLSPDTHGQAVIYDAAGRQLAVGRRFTAPAAGMYIVSLGKHMCKIVLL